MIPEEMAPELAAVPRGAAEQAYCFFHQKWRVYAGSSNERQKDDIEYAVSSYVDSMSPELYAAISGGDNSFLRDHSRFSSDIRSALASLESVVAPE